MNIQSRLVALLIEKGYKIATAESCTGGLLSEMITDISGSSKVFECGICSYSNKIKRMVLGVSQNTLDTYTEVSVQTAEEMAAGVKRISGADIAVSTTGVAGPTGGTEKNPVGTVCMAFVTPYGTVSEKRNFNTGEDDRNVIRHRCAEYCFEKIYTMLTKTDE